MLDGEKLWKMIQFQQYQGLVKNFLSHISGIYKNRLKLKKYLHYGKTKKY